MEFPWLFPDRWTPWNWFLLLPIFPVFQNDQNIVCLINITLIFDMCPYSLAAGTPVKYKCESMGVTYTVVKAKISLMEKLINEVIVTPTPGLANLVCWAAWELRMATGSKGTNNSLLVGVVTASYKIKLLTICGLVTHSFIIRDIFGAGNVCLFSEKPEKQAMFACWVKNLTNRTQHQSSQQPNQPLSISPLKPQGTSLWEALF